MKISWKTIGLIGIGAITAMVLLRESSLQSINAKYSYNVVVNGFPCKYWSYIDEVPYNIILNNGESINLNITYNIPINQEIDIVDIRFHNISSTSEGYGKMYATVNGSYALPTIGIVNQRIPMYVAFPLYPNYGTVFTTVWDTPDVKGSGTFNYVYTYEGNTPLYVKSLELYVTNRLCAV